MLASNPAELERRLRERVPNLHLVSERRLSRILRTMIESGVRVPMNAWRPLWLERPEAERFGMSIDGSDSPALLLTTPDDRLLHGHDDEVVLATYHRLVDFARHSKRSHDATQWPDAELERRFRALPAGVRREIRFVLDAEQHLPAKATDAELCREFIPVYLELLANRGDAIGDHFPLTPANKTSLDELLNGFERPDFATATVEPTIPSRPVERDVQPILEQSRNQVRAAIGYYRRPEDRDTAVGILREGLGNTLAEVLASDTSRTERWKLLLESLLPHTLASKWPPATKALYELQKLTHDLRRPLYAVAPFEWLRSWGKQSLRQPLDKARDVILLRHLSKAEKLLERVPLSESQRHLAEELFRHERHAAEARIRETLEPILTDTLTRAGLVPNSRVETIARRKLIAELIEIVYSRGFFRLSDLRDAIARNQLKLPDVSGSRELWAGDALLKADKLLADELFGIYQRGEIYLRGIQRLSAAGFGTTVGRWVTLFLLLPFLGAFLTLEFLQHVLHGVLGVVGAIRGPSADAEPHPSHHGPHLVTWWSVLLVGGFFLLLIHSPPFRRGLGQGLKALWGVMRQMVIVLPQAIWSSNSVRRIVRSPITAFLWQNFALPLAIAVVGSLVALLYDLSPWSILGIGAGVFVGTVLVLHSPPGRILYERLAEGLADTGRFIWASLIPGVVSWIVWAFREIADAVERVLYTVDEWLRFREGQSKESLVLKTILAVLWFPIAYVVRFVFYLLVEPQVNPVKHFPVVTVSHKVIWPMVPQLSALFGVSPWTMGMVVNGVPGIFGFMAWELKENWRLYAANRPTTLQPVPIGHHGETMRGLLRPGFHSGTIPKLFRKLRANHDAPIPSVRKTRHLRYELEHVREAILRLVEREWLPLVNDTSLSIDEVTLGCQRVEVSLEEVGESPPVLLIWELIENEVTAEIAERGWLDLQDESRTKSILMAIDGLRALTAVKDSRLMPWNEWVKYWETNPAVTPAGV